MALETQTFLDKVATAAQRLRQELPQDFQGLFYLHFGADYAMGGFFEDVVAEIPLWKLSEDLPDTRNLDGEEVVLRAGHCNGVPVLAACGARRVAEGYGPLAALFPTALAWAMGAKNHIFLDTAVSLHSDLKAGKWGMLTDFVNDFAFSPLEGLHQQVPNPYPNLSETLDQIQNSELINALAEFGDSPKLCTYHGVPGFHLPTVAEARHAREAGAEFLGHDLVLHLILAHALSCRVSALVLAGAQILPGAIPHFTRQEMLETGVFCSKQLKQGLRKALREMEDALEGYGENLLPEADVEELLRAKIQQCATRSSPLKAFLRH